MWRAKVSAAPVLGEMLQTTPLGPAEAAQHINANFKDRATFYRCPSEFGIKRWDGIAVYPCDLLILEMKDSGTRYIYDLVRMKKPTLTAKASLGSDLVQRLYGPTNLTGESAASNSAETSATLPSSPAPGQGGKASVYSGAGAFTGDAIRFFAVWWVNQVLRCMVG